MSDKLNAVVLCVIYVENIDLPPNRKSIRTNLENIVVAGMKSLGEDRALKSRLGFTSDMIDETGVSLAQHYHKQERLSV